MNDPHAVKAVEFACQNELMLAPEGEQHLEAGLTVHEYYTVLRARDCLADARRVLAHALPRRRALWWGLLCAWEASGAGRPENVEAVLQGVARFVGTPTESNRLALRELVELVRPQSPAHQLAQAAILSSGSMTEPPLPPVFPKPFLTGRLVGVTVYLASVARDLLHYRERLAQYLDLGVDVARGRNLWPAPFPSDRRQSQCRSIGNHSSSPECSSPTTRLVDTIDKIHRTGATVAVALDPRVTPQS